jgi:hypothetical protein
MRNWGMAYVKWGLALDEKRGPHTGGCATCSPLVTVNSRSGATSVASRRRYEAVDPEQRSPGTSSTCLARNRGVPGCTHSEHNPAGTIFLRNVSRLAMDAIDFYTLGHFSKFVLSGAIRIYSSNANGIVSAAFVNPDNSKALVVYNDSSVNQTFQVQWGTQSFVYTLPALAGATFTWSGTQRGDYIVNAKSQIQASSFSSTSGPRTTSLQTWALQTETTSDTNGGYDVGHSDNDDYAVYKNVDFGSGVSGLKVRVALDRSGGSGGTLEFHLASNSGTLVSSVAIPVTGGMADVANRIGKCLRCEQGSRCLDRLQRDYQHRKLELVPVRLECSRFRT